MIFPDSAITPLWLEVNYLGYKKQRKQIYSTLSGYDFVLEADTSQLKDLIVKNRPYIEQLGDTLRYLVNSFAHKEDRSIGDVIRRLPGVDVSEDGTIYFNGKKVENLYIHGDDLMSGRYGMATRTIRKEMIAGIDIIKNHQPIQVLRDKIFSDQTAINLILKDENSFQLSTEVMAGGGLPSQYDAAINPILLNKRVKMVNSLALNNSGVDYKNDLKQLGSANFISNIGIEPAKIDLSAGTVGPPDLPLVNYYFNRSGIISLNDLYNTVKGLQVKTNIQGYIDRNSLAYSSLTQNFLQRDTISYREKQDYIDKPWMINTSINLMSNKKNYFFNNNTQVNLSNRANQSYLAFDVDTFGQALHKRLNEFSNDMNWIPAIKGKNVVELRWLLRYTYDKQLLDIGEGYVSGIPGQSGYYDHIYQSVKLPTVFSNAYLSYRIQGRLLNQEYKIGYLTERQNLQSALNFMNDGHTIPYTGDGGNDLNWHKNNSYFSPEYQGRYKNWRATVQLPLIYQSIRYHQYSYHLNEEHNQFLFNPAASLRYNLTLEQSFTAAYKHENSFGNISNVYRGSILENYRTLQNNDAAIQEKNSNTYSFNYDYQKSITMLFLNLGITYDRITANTIFATTITDSMQRNILLPYKNDRKNLSLHAGFSKYVFSMKSTLSLKMQLKKFIYQQLINKELFPFNGYEISLAGNVNRKWNLFQFSYQPAAYWNTSKTTDKTGIVGNYNNTIFQLNQNLGVGITAIKKYYLELNARQRFISQTGGMNNQYFFLDMKMQRNNIVKGMNVSLDINNIFNVKKYGLYTVLANQLQVNQYTIRGCMAILRLDMYF